MCLKKNNWKKTIVNYVHEREKKEKLLRILDNYSNIELLKRLINKLFYVRCVIHRAFIETKY